MLSSMPWFPLLSVMRDASSAVMKSFTEGFSISEKPDETPVTSADLEANRIILEGLKKYFPAIPVVSEETASEPWDVRRTWKRFFLIDPIDGTSEFVAHRNDFTVNIALIEDGVVSLGLVSAPATGELFVGGDHQAFTLNLYSLEESSYQSLKRDSRFSPHNPKNSPPPKVLVSALHKDGPTMDFVAAVGGLSIEVGSSLKFCRIADGFADYYPRCKPLHEWDIAAGHGVLKAAGGNVYRLGTIEEVHYGTQFLETPAFEAY